MGTIVEVFERCVVVVLLSTGVRVLVHPVRSGDFAPFLLCTYGYATTSWRAQGSTLDIGCIWFDHWYPPERGYGYVAVSRFRTQAGVFLYGPVRRTDWLPVGGDSMDEQVHCSFDSGSEADDPYEDMGSESDEDDALCPVNLMRSGHDAFASERRHYPGDDFFVARDSSGEESSSDDFYASRDTSSDAESVLASYGQSIGSPASPPDCVYAAGAAGDMPLDESELLSLLR